MNQLTSEKHEVLYHYTTFAGFKGIIETQTLWAKYFRDLNDSSEVFHIQKKLHGILVPTIKREIKLQRSKLKKLIKKCGGRDAFARHEANAVLKALFEVTFGSEDKEALHPPFITSFCSHIDDKKYVKENGLLSMWRGYGSDGGIAIVLDTKRLELCLQMEGENHLYSFGALDDVVYDDDEESFLKKFAEFIDLFKQTAMSMLLDGDSFQVDDEFIKLFINTATRYKHQAFEEEREVRIVASPWTDDQFASATTAEKKGEKKKVQIVRENAKFIDLFDDKTFPRLPITKVIVGPYRNQDERYKETCSILKNWKGVDVVRSETPYIERQ